MRGVSSSLTRGLPIGAFISPCDNSGAKLIQIIGVMKQKTRKGRFASATIADIIQVRVVKGRPDIRHKMSFAVVVRQRMPFRRSDGTHIKFEDNAVVLLKDEKGNPKGTIFKGPIAKEAAERWDGIAKLSSIIV
jgi:large subunit ribosomal protein L14